MNTTDDRELEQLLAPDLTWGIARTAAGYLGLVRDPACHASIRTLDDHRARLVANAAAGCPERLAQAHAVLWALAEPEPAGPYATALMPAFIERRRAAQRLHSLLLTDWYDADRTARAVAHQWAGGAERLPRRGLRRPWSRPRQSEPSAPGSRTAGPGAASFANPLTTDVTRGD